MFKNSKVKKLLAFSVISSGVLFCGTSVSATMRRPGSPTGGASSSTTSTRPRVRTTSATTGERQGLLSSGGNSNNYGTFKTSATGRSSKLDPNKNPSGQDSVSWSEYKFMLKQMRDEAAEVQQRRATKESEVKYGVFVSSTGLEFEVPITDKVVSSGMKVVRTKVHGGEESNVTHTGGGRYMLSLSLDDVERLNNDPNTKLNVTVGIDHVGQSRPVIIVDREGTLVFQPELGIFRDARKDKDGTIHLGAQRYVQQLLDSGVPGIRDFLREIGRYTRTVDPWGSVDTGATGVTQSTRL